MGHGAIIAGQIFNGFSVGSILLLIALGLALSFGLMNVINMAHGEMLMVGGYLSYLACKIVHGPMSLLVAFIFAFFGAALLGAVRSSPSSAGSTGGHSIPSSPRGASVSCCNRPPAACLVQSALRSSRRHGLAER
jgi:hypothetical protein